MQYPHLLSSFECWCILVFTSVHSYTSPLCTDQRSGQWNCISFQGDGNERNAAESEVPLPLFFATPRITCFPSTDMIATGHGSVPMDCCQMYGLYVSGVLCLDFVILCSLLMWVHDIWTLNSGGSRNLGRGFSHWRTERTRKFLVATPTSGHVNAFDTRIYCRCCTD